MELSRWKVLMAVLIAVDFNGVFLLSSPCCSTLLAFRRGGEGEEDGITIIDGDTFSLLT